MDYGGFNPIFFFYNNYKIINFYNHLPNLNKHSRWQTSNQSFKLLHNLLTQINYLNEIIIMHAQLLIVDMKPKH